mmetsp:Transcript_22867/g.67499  ORF Transcript_22867/g.67499 Transcript_22867/m.67499 type:complete len:469 (-) Transcript_22867:119-1525(-)
MDHDLGEETIGEGGGDEFGLEGGVGEVLLARHTAKVLVPSSEVPLEVWVGVHVGHGHGVDGRVDHAGVDVPPGEDQRRYQIHLPPGVRRVVDDHLHVGERVDVEHLDLGGAVIREDGLVLRVVAGHPPSVEPRLVSLNEGDETAVVLVEEEALDGHAGRLEASAVRGHDRHAGLPPLPVPPVGLGADGFGRGGSAAFAGRRGEHLGRRRYRLAPLLVVHFLSNLFLHLDLVRHGLVVTTIVVQAGVVLHRRHDGLADDPSRDGVPHDDGISVRDPHVIPVRLGRVHLVHVRVLDVRIVRVLPPSSAGIAVLGLLRAGIGRVGLFGGGVAHRGHGVAGRRVVPIVVRGVPLDDPPGQKVRRGQDVVPELIAAVVSREDVGAEGAGRVGEGSAERFRVRGGSSSRGFAAGFVRVVVVGRGVDVRLGEIAGGAFEDGLFGLGLGGGGGRRRRGRRRRRFFGCRGRCIGGGR